MMDHVFSVRNWSELFETNESRKLARAMDWVKMRTKHDGRSYRRLLEKKNAILALCGWYLILQVAGKMPVRGLLADIDGPLDAEDLAYKTGLPKIVFVTALNLLALREIGWLEQLEWSQSRDFWGNVAELGLTPAYHGKWRKRTGERGRGNPDPEDRLPPGKPEESGGERERPEDTGQDRNGSGETGVHNSTGDNSTVPSAVSLEGRQPAARCITSPDEAKRLICKLILGGKDPNRPWSYAAQESLEKLTRGPGLPVYEIERIAWFRAIPKSDDVQELRDRKDPVTETGLTGFWGDEFVRAEAYFKKIARPQVVKNEPPRWREFFHWQYDHGITLPETWDKLEPDQQAEYRREFSTFEQATKKKDAA